MTESPEWASYSRERHDAQTAPEARMFDNARGRWGRDGWDEPGPEDARE